MTGAGRTAFPAARPAPPSYDEEVTVSVQIGRPDIAPMARGRLMAACRRGELPAEALDTADREHLVYDFWAGGWSDVEIATHTRMTT